MTKEHSGCGLTRIVKILLMKHHAARSDWLLNLELSTVLIDPFRCFYFTVLLRDLSNFNNHLEKYSEGVAACRVGVYILFCLAVDFLIYMYIA